MQINLEDDDNIGYIFILYPPDLNNNTILLKLLTDKNIIKILHGGESLDIPYLFDEFLLTKKNIINFCYNLYDTKFLCDYYNIINNKNNKCSIYYLLKDHNIITNDKLLKLQSIEENTGPMYLIHTDIYALDINILKYALYDVLYLPELLKRFLEKSKIYKNIIPNLTSFNYKYKKNIYFNNIEFENNINNMNLYYIINNNNKILLIDIWKLYYLNNIIDNFFKINYFKKFLNILTKAIIYYEIFNNIKIYNNNNIIINEINTIKHFIKIIKKHKFVYKIIKKYYYYIKNELKKYYI